MSITEGMVRSLFQEQLEVDLGAFPRMTWADAMERYGSINPTFGSSGSWYPSMT